MSYDFDTLGWAAEIEAVSSDSEYQNCTIKLRDPTTTSTVLVTTQARIIPLRAQVDVSGAAVSNPSGSKSLLIQFPYAAYATRVKRGTFVQVTAGGRNPALTGYLITVVADNLSGNGASHGLECTVDVESSATWT